MPVRTMIAVALVALAGCAHATLPYTPEQQPPGARISAAYQTVGDDLRVEIDTGGRRLEQAWIIKPDGTSVGAVAVENPPVAVGPGPSVGVGVGGGTWGGRGGLGTGVSVGIPVGSPSRRIAGNTIVTFPLPQAGPGPWSVYVKLAGTPAATIVVGGPPPAR
jgi:hypothetical protein